MPQYVPVSLTTVGSAAEEIVEPMTGRAYLLKYLSAYKDSTFTLNISIETARGYRTVFTETVTNGGTIVCDDAIFINDGERLVSQTSSAGIDINCTFEITAPTVIG